MKTKLIASCALAGALLLLGASCVGSPPSLSFTTSSLDVTATAPAPTFLPSFTEVIAQVLPSVVSVETDIAAGTGWVLDASGIIVTNEHVVEGASTVSVTLSNGQSYLAQSVASDATSDLAIIRIKASGLTPAPLGSSAALRLGEPVATLGNALGNGIAMTGGWVSRLGATADIQGRTLDNLIQTDAAINEGNSGGPLLNLAGQLVGIVDAKLVQTGVEGIGYAISIDSALPLLTQLVNTGTIVRPFLGIGNLADATGGVAIGVVSPGTPAAQAGLLAGDVITAVDGQPTPTVTDLRRVVLAKQVGQRINITYLRGTLTLNAFATLAQTPTTPS